MQYPAVSRSRHLTVCDGVSVCGHASVFGRHASGLCIEYSFPTDSPPVGPRLDEVRARLYRDPGNVHCPNMVVNTLHSKQPKYWWIWRKKWKKCAAEADLQCVDKAKIHPNRIYVN